MLLYRSRCSDAGERSVQLRSIGEDHSLRSRVVYRWIGQVVLDVLVHLYRMLWSQTFACPLLELVEIPAGVRDVHAASNKLIVLGPLPNVDGDVRRAPK